MDQIKIGKFIASCRKEQAMTQAVLAEKLGISDRAISKWETGKAMPDSGIKDKGENPSVIHFVKTRDNHALRSARIYDIL